ncbi:MAG: RES family NAD+ phosphorylase [Pseudomonadota bacterium]
MTPPTSRVRWSQGRRIQSTRHPPVDLFEDLLDPEDWEAAIRLESLTNPRINESVGRLDLVPVARRVAGAGASLVMAPFTHVSTDHPGRFHDGNFGALYIAQTFNTALAETAFHYGRFFAATGQAPGWFSQYRELACRVDHSFHDLRGTPDFSACLAPDDWSASQALARELRDRDSSGIVYPSVRDPDGQCLAAFWPDVVPVPVPARRLSYHFDGAGIDVVRDDSDRQIIRLKHRPS